ncbi:hypothetical protein PSP31121_04862 [Pandoraea sputorum]|uniref:Uncharacterized protein n=1 Tax=Pandoraea sputorum TaxID=93222 RepID=A0A5E5BFI1_9BURK|nr:hypothetical protein [Pandoraea sputorum]VVE84659.1 hypothetical protein PSP31121_04862 [Pandoraea sputorum]
MPRAPASACNGFVIGMAVALPRGYDGAAARERRAPPGEAARLMPHDLAIRQAETMARAGQRQALLRREAFPRAGFG